MRDGVILVESGHVVHGACAMMQWKRAIDNDWIVMDRAAVSLWLMAVSMLTVSEGDAHAHPGTRFFDKTLGELRSELAAACRESKTACCWFSRWQAVLPAGGCVRRSSIAGTCGRIAASAS